MLPPESTDMEAIFPIVCGAFALDDPGHLFVSDLETTRYMMEDYGLLPARGCGHIDGTQQIFQQSIPKY